MLGKSLSDATEYVERRTAAAAVTARDALLPVAFTFALMSLVAPKFSHTLLPAAFACLVLLHGRSAARQTTAQPMSFGSGFTSIYFIAAALYLFARAVTAPQPASALALLAVFGAFLTMAWQMSRTLTGLHPIDQRKLTQGLLAGTLVGAVYLVAELLTSQSIVTSILNHVPLLAGGRKSHFIIADERIQSVRTYVLNRNIGVLNLLFWPVLLIAANEAERLKDLKSKLCVYGLFFATFCATFLSVHKTSKVALVFACAVFVLSKLSKRAALSAMTVIWMLATLAVVPASRIAYDNGLQNSTVLAGSARARIVIWNFEAQQIPEAWLLGRGIQSVIYYDQLQAPTATVVPGELSAQRNGHHSHNIYLQIWYELGAVGALLFSIAGLLILRRIASMPARSFPFAIAAFASVTAIMAFSWGLWQHWYFAAVCMSAAVLALASTGERTGGMRGAAETPSRTTSKA